MKQFSILASLVLFVLAVSVAFTSFEKKMESVSVNQVGVESNTDFFIASMFSDIYVISPNGEVVAEYVDEVVEATQDAKVADVFHPPAAVNRNL